MKYLYTSESVSEGHPDKVADQISDALLDEFLRHDENSKVALETLVTTGLVVCSGEVRTKCYVDIQSVVRKTIDKIGYNKAEYRFDNNSCGIISTIEGQSDDIFMGVGKKNAEDQGAGDQGMMYGYATNEMDNLMPMPIEISHIILQELAKIRREGKYMKYLRPDSKSQVTIEYDDHKPVRIDTIVISTQHDEFIKPSGNSEKAIAKADKEMQNQIKADIIKYLMPRVAEQVPANVKKMLSDSKIKYFVNPTGKFVIGGPHGDTGLTGRKIIVDTYGGKGAHGGGAFSGKDSSKVDRSGAYAARYIAKNMVAAGVADEMLVQIAYAIGVAKPVSIFVDTNNTAKAKDEKGKIISDAFIAKKITQLFDLRPYNIIKTFGLKNPIYEPTASYGHFGRTPYEMEVEVYYSDDKTKSKKDKNTEKYYKKVSFFAWEKLDAVEKIKKGFNIK